MRRLTAMMGTYPKTEPLKSGAVPSPFDFDGIEVAQQGFRNAVRELKYDVTELALMTFLMAYEAGGPYVLLPFAMNGGDHHGSILCRAGSELTPRDLPGKTVAQRSYAQTTPAWVRGFLADEYGVRAADVRWLTQEDAHVAEYRDPPWAVRDDSGRGLDDLLLSGDADAIISGGKRAPDPRIRPLIPDPVTAAVEPVNHIVAIRREVAASEPETVREVFRLLTAIQDTRPVGFAAVRPALETAIRYAHEQRLITKRYAVDDLYGPVADAL
ncbi:MAG TPA: hypothetical protein VGL93_13900 [Streptosporangiaceae bacterium]|jgi:4,5-dihydroxyphthalate decarboxylase